MSNSSSQSQPVSALLGAVYSAAEIMESMGAVGLRQEREIEQLRLAICGGEDAPGYAASLPLQAILDMADENMRVHTAEIERSLGLEAGLIRAVQLAEKAIKIAEDNGNHDLGAYDSDCPVCVALEALRGEVSGLHDDFECVERASFADGPKGQDGPDSSPGMNPKTPTSTPWRK